jgi:HAD superfamily phosphoserine phosphatase-like hydrolase
MSARWSGGPRLGATGAWDPAIAAGLERMLETTPADPPPVAAFDWDETCIRGDISETWLTYLDEAEPGRLAAYEAAVAADKRAAYERLAIELVQGRHEVEVRRAVDDAFRRAVTEGRIGMRPAIRDLIWAMHRHGWQVWVVTASPTPVVQTVAQHYGIHPDHVIGMSSPPGEDGRYRPSLVAPVPFREGKLAALLARTGREPTFAAGDSDGDLWMLRAARHALLIDRGERTDPAVRAAATEAGWWVQRGWG